RSAPCFRRSGSAARSRCGAARPFCATATAWLEARRPCEAVADPDRGGLLVGSDAAGVDARRHRDRRPLFREQIDALHDVAGGGPDRAERDDGLLRLAAEAERYLCLAGRGIHLRQRRALLVEQPQRTTIAM